MTRVALPDRNVRTVFASVPLEALFTAKYSNEFAARAASRSGLYRRQLGDLGPNRYLKQVLYTWFKPVSAYVVSPCFAHFSITLPFLVPKQCKFRL